MIGVWGAHRGCRVDHSFVNVENLIMLRHINEKKLCAVLLLLALCGNANAGILVLDANGIATKWTSNGGTEYYFHQGSYNDNSLAVTVIAAEDPVLAQVAMKESLRDATSPTADRTVAYAFATSVDSTNVLSHIVTWITSSPHNNQFVSDLDETVARSTETYTTSFSPTETRTIYWASTIAPTSGDVPEPSTAIAVGLLGVVGFAGNRRRRRQVSAA